MINKKISIVIPVYNEEEVLEELHFRVINTIKKISNDYEIIFINDGSIDKSLEILKDFSAKDKRIKILSFSRNFGHQIAISAGLNFISGDIVAIMDADLQDPPEIIFKFIERWQAGYQIVYGIRKKRKERVFKKIAYSIFYRLLKLSSNLDIPLDAGDFCLMDKKVADLINKFPERTRFLRGIRSWVGFSQVGVEYERDKRFAGKPKYTFSKLLRLALDGFISFSDLPLKIATIIGFIISFLSICFAVFLVFIRLITKEFIPGWASITVAITFLSGIQLIMFGILFYYINKIFNEVKRRPLYILDEKIGFKEEK